MDELLQRTLRRVIRFYDQRKVGELGPLGFRRSTDLATLWQGLPVLVQEQLLVPGRTRLLDLGCADGRVNVLLSYVVQSSVGVEVDEWTLDEYAPMRDELDQALQEDRLLPIQDNVRLFLGDATGPEVYRRIEQATGIGFREFDLFYTFLLGHDAYADLIARDARQGAVFVVFGMDQIFPKYPGLSLIEPLSPLAGAMAIYRKH